MKGPGLIAKTYDASVFPALLFPPKGPKPIPATAMSSRLPPTNERAFGGGATPTHFFPSHTEKNKHLLDKQRKIEFFLGECQNITIHTGQCCEF